MTIEEAIKDIKENIQPSVGGKSLEMAIAALEKQMSKKVNVWANETEHCPSCEHDISCLGFNVCVNCGQVIDWSEEE